MRLKDLITYPEIFIQCHDNPDADSLASAYGLYLYFISKDIPTRILYAGKNKIQKPNLLMMIKEFKIPIDYFPSEIMSVNGLLLTVDCTYGENNVSRIKADAYASIDHHDVSFDMKMSEIRPYLGSCSTLVWDMLKADKFPIYENSKLSTALYYGLMTDTGNFTEELHPLDYDMKDSLHFDQTVITRLINSNISIKELEIAGLALIKHIYNDDHRYAIVHCAPCDPNILGIISDLVIQVDKIDTCLVYNDTDDGFKLSVRSCIKEVRANELVQYITEGIGSGGGHHDKAGGFILKSAYEAAHPTITTETYFGLKLSNYFDNCQIIYAPEYSFDSSDAKEYVKKDIILGFVPMKDLGKINTVIVIRTISGDLSVKIKENCYIVMDPFGSVSIVKDSDFDSLYRTTEETYKCSAYYSPSVRLSGDENIVHLEEIASACRLKVKPHVFAKPINGRVKLFTLDNPERYQLGKNSDFMICPTDNKKDVRIVSHNLFYEQYSSL